MGAAFGSAMVGTRPIVEMRFADFALCATDELVNQIAKARFMFGGQSRAPMVIRKPMGMWRSSAAQHSQSLEGWYTHIPGLVVVAIFVAVGQGFVYPSLTSHISKLAPEDHRGSILGISTASSSLSRVCGPIVAGVLYDQWAGYGAFWGLAVGVLIGLLLAVRLGPLARTVPVSDPS